MNSETKEILIDLIGYYNVIGTEDDPGFVPFADIVQRASRALEKHAKDKSLNSADVDPYAMDVLGNLRDTRQLSLKLEDEW